MTRLCIAILAVCLPCLMHAQDAVIANGTTSVIPELHGDKPFLDRDLQNGLRQFNGQNTLGSLTRSVGVVDRTIPSSMVSHRQPSLIAEGVVLHTEAYITPDKNGMVTILTVLPTLILRQPNGYPPPPPSAPPAPRLPLGQHRTPPPPIPPRPAASTLRVALAGGTVYFDDNNGATLRQPGIRYPAPGESLIVFAELMGNAGDPPTSVLRLLDACSLHDNACASIDGNPNHSDALAQAIPDSMDAAAAYNVANAPIADTASEGVRGLASSLEGRYNLGQGSLRNVPGPEISMPPFAAASENEAFLRVHILKSDATLTVGALGVVMTATAAIDKVYAGTLPSGKTLDIVQRGGFLWKNNTTLLSALASTQQPLVDGGTYYLAVGRTTDNRWELQYAWRVINDKVFAMDRPRGLTYTPTSAFYWKSTNDFLKQHGLH